MSKVSLLMLTLSLSLWAKQELLLKTDLDLYQQPTEHSLKKERHFQKGERIDVHGCDRYGWCRVDRGYVKGYKIGLASATKTKRSQRASTPQIVTEKIDLSLYEPKSAEDLNRSNIQSTSASAPQTPYANYFEPKSARLNLHVTP
ncbi:MAG: hypothetical protein JXK05_03675 [Campylobacterales bacterium]|nr:hypothetical protein [Campylobacterales bacterium]